MDNREKESMHLLKNVYDSFYALPLSERLNLQGTELEAQIDCIPSQLKLYKADVLRVIGEAVAESNINQRFKKHSKRPKDTRSG